MDESFSLKKPLIILAVIIGAIVYIRSHYTFEDALRYAKKNPHRSYSEKIEYRIASWQFMRAKYPKAARAYEQLLTQHPTSQYAPKALLRLGDAKLKMLRYKEATSAWAKYIEDYPDGPDIAIVKKKHEYNKFK